MDESNPVYPTISSQPISTTYPKGLKWLWVLIAILLIAGFIALIITLIIPQNSVTVSDQVVKEYVFIKKTTLTEGGFLIIQVANRYGKPSQLIGSTEYLLPDTYTEFSVDLPQTVLENRDNDGLKGGGSIFISLFKDSNGTKSFELGQDKPIKDWFGKPIIKKIRLK